jgi:3-ketosteroid 9alpha-monooxygenase subunit B
VPSTRAASRSGAGLTDTATEPAETGAESPVLKLEVVDVVQETGEACSIVMRPPRPVRYTSGQFLTVAVPSARTGTVARCYSLSSAPHETDLLKVTVKRTADGYASNWLCDHLRPGDVVTVLPPSGIFTPKDLDHDFLLFAGGSGITPVISIAKSALARGAGQVVLVYANRDPDAVIFADELRTLADQHPDRFVLIHWLEVLQGLPTQEHMRAIAAHHTSYDAFVCGPGPFMKGVVSALKELGFPRERRHQEKFVSLGGNPFGEAADDITDEIAAAEGLSGPDADTDAGEASAEVKRDSPASVSGDLDGEEFSFEGWQPDEPLLDFLLGQGVQAPYSCREGHCSACACVVLEGEVAMRTNDVLDEEDLADGIRLACQSLPVSDTLRISYSG